MDLDFDRWLSLTDSQKMTSHRTKSASSENGGPGSPMNVSTVAFLPEKSDKEKSGGRTKYPIVKIVLAAIPVFLLLSLVIVLVILLTRSKTQEEPEANGQNQRSAAGCVFSEEAKRIGLDSFINELERKYYEMVPEKLGLKPRVTRTEIRENYRPYDPRPSALKNYTDEVRSLRDRLEVIIGMANGSRLNLRENKAMYLAQQLLRHWFDWGPYERDYYAGDWMFEPNLYCWQPICEVLTNLERVIFEFEPENLAGIEAIEDLLKKHNDTISHYIENLKLGVAAGMVRSVQSCKAGIHAIKRNYYEIAVNNASGILKGAVAKILAARFTAKITSEMNTTWYKRRGESVHGSLKRFLLVYLGEPLHRLIRYLETEHLKYCYKEVTGMIKLPLHSIYVDGYRDHTRSTTRTLPNGDPINTTNSYTRILSFFTSGGISPEELRDMGYKKLDNLLGQAKKLAKQYTKIEDENTAVLRFREVLTSRDMFFNDEPFPDDESAEKAYMKCADTLEARTHCPVRWKALQKWINSTKHVANLLRPKLSALFYDRNPKKTMPSCGISVKGEYNPEICFHGYEPTYRGCAVSAYETLPFFMNNHGPKYTAYTTTSHEQLPGHHLEVKGFLENFNDSCGDAISWISQANYLPSFTEGWATYVEYPLMAEDTDAYANISDKNVLLQKYGMLKYQILAALRSVLDTGMNYFGMTRHEAKLLYDKYAWDVSDLVTKDITRYQSSPGVVASYMIGQETFVKLRKQAESELGSDFSLKEFHYQILRQGEIPLKYMEYHISRFINCKKDSTGLGCEEILS